jgi:hypothetical protein
MTWAEFKKAVEDKGVRDDDDMSYIDVNDDDLVVEIKPNPHDEKHRFFHIWS